MRSESLDAIGPAGYLLRVEFAWSGDRFAHTISTVNVDGIERLLDSIEGTPSDDWPPSPPLQSLHRETLPDGRTAILLVGAAGRSHWSASIEAAPNQPQLLFDFACRHGGECGWLGNRYRASPTARKRLLIQADGTAASWLEEGLEFKGLTGQSTQSGQPTTSRWRFSLSLRE